MDLNYVNKKLCENIFNPQNNIDSEETNFSHENKTYVFSLYEGYDIYLLLDCLLSEIKTTKILGNIYMINFSDYFIKLMNNNYNNNIDSVTNKNRNDVGKIFSVTDRVFLKDLISREIFLSQISAVIISPTTYFDLKEKIWCIIKFLSEEGKNILFFYFLQNQKNFDFFIYTLNNSIKLSKNNFKYFIIPRNNILVEKIINRKFQLNKISLIEVNINNNNNIANSNIPLVKNEIKILLEKLLKITHEEFIKNIISNNIFQEINPEINKLLSDFYDYKLINNEDSINNIHFKLMYLYNEKNFKIKNLYYDLLSIKFLLKKLESYDIASIYNIFKEIKSYSEKENSIFSYQDSTTENLIYDLCNKFKNNLFEIKFDEKRIITEEENVILDEFFELYIFINMTPELKSELRRILEQNIIELKCDNDFFKINYYKYIQLINILESKIINNNFDTKKNSDDSNNNNIDDDKKENVLIITNSESEIDNFKSIFNIYGLHKKLNNNSPNFFYDSNYLSDNPNIFKEFFEYNFRRFLINRREFLSRYQIISNIKSSKNMSNYTKENLFLHYLCYKLTRNFDIKNEGLFDRIYDIYQKNNKYDIELLPSEFAEELTEEIFNEYIQQNFNEDEAFPFIKLDYISLNNGKEYYKKEINLIEKLRNKNYSKIILYDYNTNILRNIECFITNYNQSINSIILFLDYDSYNFKIDFNHIKIQSSKFNHILKEPIIIKEKISTTNLIELKREEKEKYNIIVDFREMGTKTPYYLYKNNFTIINGSLEVGDYILTNNYCIERKSISTKDFYQSLNNSKHLIEQTIKMGKYFKNIILLLEFEETFDIINTFDSGICYKPIIMRKLLDLTNITELAKNNFLFIWSLNCKMTSKLLKNLRIKLSKEILDIDYCLNINKLYKGNLSKNQKRKELNNNNEINTNINNNSQQIKTIESFFGFNNINENKNKEINDEKKIEKYETNSNNDNYINEIINKKLDISTEKIIRNIPGINSNNYNLITNNFNNLYEFITCKKEKKYEIFGRITGTKIFSLFNYEFQ